MTASLVVYVRKETNRLCELAEYPRLREGGRKTPRECMARKGHEGSGRSSSERGQTDGIRHGHEGMQ